MDQTQRTSIGFLGLGHMGASMAERLLAPDIDLYVYDTREEAMEPFVKGGATACASPALVATKAEIIFASLPNPHVSETVASEVAGGSAVRVYAEMSTIGQESMERIAKLLAARGIGLVDSPVSGGPASASAGNLTLLAAGAPEAVAAVKPWQLRIGKTVFVMGDRPGQAQVMKLVNNLLLAANLVTACEGFVMGAKAGIDPDAMLAMVNAGTGRSLVTEQMMEQVLSGRFAFGGALALMDKDARLGLAEATALNVPMWTLEQAARVWRFAMIQGAGNQDVTAIARVMEEWAGVEVRRRTKE
jgi:3-hydroxyisobutyrate dehydrogenase-like beta-hydroxyacid dehydrogenase